MKVGDKVRVIRDQIPSLPAGYVGYITGLAEDDMGKYVDIDNIEPFCVYDPSALEIIEE